MLYITRCKLIPPKKAVLITFMSGNINLCKNLEVLYLYYLITIEIDFYLFCEGENNFVSHLFGDTFITMDERSVSK